MMSSRHSTVSFFRRHCVPAIVEDILITASIQKQRNKKCGKDEAFKPVKD